MQHTITTEDIRDMFAEFYREFDEVTDYTVRRNPGERSDVTLTLRNGVVIYASVADDEDGWNAAVYASADEARRREYLAHDGDDNMPALQHFVQRYVDQQSVGVL